MVGAVCFIGRNWMEQGFKESVEDYPKIGFCLVPSLREGDPSWYCWAEEEVPEPLKTVAVRFEEIPMIPGYGFIVATKNPALKETASLHIPVRSTSILRKKSLENYLYGIALKELGKLALEGSRIDNRTPALVELASRGVIGCLFYEATPVSVIIDCQQLNGSNLYH